MARLFALSTLIAAVAALTTAPANNVSPANNTPALPGKYFNVSAITVVKGNAVMQCWQLTEPLLVAPQGGNSFAAFQSIGNFVNASYTYIPQNFPVQPHPAPNFQYLVFLSGKAKITIPASNQEATLEGGKPGGIVFVGDVASRTNSGHISQILEATTSLQLPTADGKEPAHKRLYRGPCKASELTF